jgi:hypothetical protein
MNYAFIITKKIAKVNTFYEYSIRIRLEFSNQILI